MEQIVWVGMKGDALQDKNEEEIEIDEMQHLSRLWLEKLVQNISRLDG